MICKFQDINLVKSSCRYQTHVSRHKNIPKTACGLIGRLAETCFGCKNHGKSLI